MLVYVKSLWHQFCDPFVTIVAKTADDAEFLLDDGANEEWQRMIDDTICPECGDWGEPYTEDGEDGVFLCDVHGEFRTENDIMTGGVFSEDLETFELRPDQLAELIEDGYTYLDN